MSEERDPVDELKAFLKIHVEERRRIVRDALETTSRRGSGLEGSKLLQIQDQIDAILRAVAHEETIQNEEGRAFDVKALVG